MSAIVVLSTRNPLPTPGALLNRPDLAAFWIADRNCVRELLTDPALRVYPDMDVPVIAVSESAADAERLHRWAEGQNRRVRHAH